MSFVRKHTSNASASSSTHSTPGVAYQTISTGIPSLDDILGGGLPFGSVLLVLGTDLHTSYPDLIHRYFVAQGLASGHDVIVVGKDAEEMVSNCMWMQLPEIADRNDNDDDNESSSMESARSLGIKIAWRYENMKQFQTSVAHEGSTRSSYPLDLTMRIPDHILKGAISSEQLHYMHADRKIFASLDALFMSKPNDIFRLSIPLLGSPDWGDLSPSDLLRFLHRLRALLRQHATRVCACVSLPVWLLKDDFGGAGWLKKLALLSDGCIRLQSFAADPWLSAMFPSQHGLVHIENLPVPYSLVTPSDRFSELRGLSSFSSTDTGGGENNLAFKCTRKRFIIETLHLDVEGGVSERRTTASTVADSAPSSKPSSDTVLASVPIIREEPTPASSEVVVGGKNTKKKKKKVNFQNDRPDVYDF